MAAVYDAKYEYDYQEKESKEKPVDNATYITQAVQKDKDEEFKWKFTGRTGKYGNPIWRRAIKRKETAAFKAHKAAHKAYLAGEKAKREAELSALSSALQQQKLNNTNNEKNYENIGKNIGNKLYPLALATGKMTSELKQELAAAKQRKAQLRAEINEIDRLMGSVGMEGGRKTRRRISKRRYTRRK